MSIALAHDFLIRLGGAERVLAALAEIFPDAPIFTLLYDEKKTGSVFPRKKIITSRLQRLPAAVRKNYRYFLPMLPAAAEEWDFSGFDTVITSSSAFTHGAITSINTRHICYCHSPMRFAWDWTHEYLKENKISGAKHIALSIILKKIRMWDRAAADRPAGRHPR